MDIFKIRIQNSEEKNVILRLKNQISTFKFALGLNLEILRLILEF